MRNYLFLLPLIIFTFFSLKTYGYTNEVLETTGIRSVIRHSAGNFLWYEIENKDKSYKYSIRFSNSAAVVIQCVNKGNIWYETIASIGTAILPKTIQGICMIMLRNPSICNAVYKVSQTLVTIFEDDIREGITNGIEWVANKGSSRNNTSSWAKIETKTIDIAEGSAKVFEEYRKKEYISWGSVNASENTNTGTYTLPSMVDTNCDCGR